MRWPWQREPSIVDRMTDWIAMTQKALDEYDPQGAAEFRDYTESFLAAHHDPPPSNDEAWWFVERGMRIVRASAERLDVA